MSLFDELGPRVAAELSERRHSVPEELLLGADAASRMAQALGSLVEGRRAVVLADVRTYEVAGAACAEALRDAGFDAHPLLVPDGPTHTPICDDLTRNRLRAVLPAADVLVGVGSGVISDLAKWLAFEADLPAAVVGTAASMNGYAAANVAPAIDGVKSLFKARAHRLVAADPAVLAAAPAELTTAGLGDVIAKSVSTADWRMNELLFGESYSVAVASIIDDVESSYLQAPEALANKDPEAVAGLFRALVYSGCAMTLQGSSMPASGGEHLISHALDMRASAEAVHHDLHGRQVGLGTIFVAALYERVLAIESPDFVSGALQLDRHGWGSLADAVAREHTKQSARMADAADRLRQGDSWDRLREALASMVPDPAWVKGVLRGAAAAHRIAEIGCDEERFVWAVHNGAQMRERFTSLDLAWVTGVLPNAASEIVEAYLR